LGMTDMLCGVLYMEYDSPEEAERYARRFAACPHVAFWATKEGRAYVLLVVPEEDRYWPEYIGEHPRETFGGVKADLVLADKVYYPNLEMRIPDEPGDISPCGSNCAECPAYLGSSCRGCPATVHFKG